uniref:Uncharacterized protein n=1 Tax=Schistosoma haematobium TaxID=6185 RepID=A0A094ZRH6_SCHHA
MHLAFTNHPLREDKRHGGVPVLESVLEISVDWNLESSWMRAEDNGQNVWTINADRAHGNDSDSGNSNDGNRIYISSVNSGNNGNHGRIG